MTDRSHEQFISAIGQWAHDMNNYVAALEMNISFLQSAKGLTDDEKEALEDCVKSLSDEKQAMHNLRYIQRELLSEAIEAMHEADVSTVLSELVKKSPVPITLDVPPEALQIKKATGLRLLLPILWENTQKHAPDSAIDITVRVENDHIVLYYHDDGPAMSEDLAETAFDLEKQRELSRHPMGRYSHSLGLCAAKAVANAMDATIEIEQSGDARFVAKILFKMR
ncbi:MAG: HAMP domain-containing histidine kinase [Myxococcales bacterium]|nr:MAG: HAMP domain-containing histidine kinase [Myxococcales bacterium]